MWARAADVLIGPLHDAAKDVLSEAQTNPEVEEQTEDLVAERMKQLGFGLSRSEMKPFIMTRQDIAEHQGPSQAAADALGDAIEGRPNDDGTPRGRKVYRAKARRARLPPVAGPLHRYVPLRDVARYLGRVLAEAEDQGRRVALLPLAALGSNVYAEALQDRVESSFKKRMRDELERGFDTMTEFFLRLLRGENPLPDLPTTPQIEQTLAAFSSLGKELLASSPAGPAVLVKKAREAARWWIIEFMAALDIEQDAARS
jgi:hypothetical protein